jgi:hypothetical protein
LRRLQGCIDRGLQAVAAEQEPLKGYVEEVKRIAATLDPRRGAAWRRQERFGRLKRRLLGSGDAVLRKMAVVRGSFAAGLFVGPEDVQEVQDNLELERWFRLPKGHQRRIHGRCHAGVRLVQQGATLMPVLEAPKGREEPSRAEELLPDRGAQPPPQEQEAQRRRQFMRRARSSKQRPTRLADLERRYLASS